MATPLSVVAANIALNSNRKLPQIHETPEWRARTKVALVGGGPSLAEHLEELRSFPVIIACGSVHDYLVENLIDPTYTVISDPDPLVLEYLKHPRYGCKYLVASQCDESIFKHLISHDVVLWHCSDNGQHQEIWNNEDKVLIGGGCTVGSRAFVIAYNCGYSNFHFFGMDSSVRGDRHHAYNFQTDHENLGELHEIALDPEGDKYVVAAYMLAQLMDFWQLFKALGRFVSVEVHGDGAMAALVDFVKGEGNGRQA